MCQLFRGFSDQIVRQNHLAVCVQESYEPCECFQLQIMLIEEQRTVYGKVKPEFETTFTNKVYVSDIIRPIQGAVKAHPTPR
jgi:hypothetical protein